MRACGWHARAHRASSMPFRKKFSASALGVRLLAVAAFRALASCASTDLGAPCHLLRADGSELEPLASHDIVQSGSGECDQFACVSFNGTAPACSRPCEVDGSPCENGWRCRNLVLDPTSLALVRERTEGRDDDRNGVDDFQQLAAGLTESLYCGPAP